MDQTARVRRRWLWYAVPAILGLIAIVAVVTIPFAVKLKQARQQHAAVEAIRRLGGDVLYDYQWEMDGSRNALPPGPAWLRDLFGVDMLATVVDVHLGPDKPTDAVLDDAGLQELEEHLKALPGLEMLGISRTKVTDAGLKHVAALKQVRSLYLCGTSITDSGLHS